MCCICVQALNFLLKHPGTNCSNCWCKLLGLWAWCSSSVCCRLQLLHGCNCIRMACTLSLQSLTNLCNNRSYFSRILDRLDDSFQRGILLRSRCRRWWSLGGIQFWIPFFPQPKHVFALICTEVFIPLLTLVSHLPFSPS